METREGVIQTYEKILTGEMKSFSPYFFQLEHRKERVETLARYLIEDKLRLTPAEALEKLTFAMVEQYKLDCILKYIDKPVEFLDDDVKHLVYFAYSDLPKPTTDELAIISYKDVLAGNRKTFPKNYFLGGPIGERRAIVCFRYLCEEILKLDLGGVIAAFNGTQGLKVLSEHRLKIIMNVVFISAVDLLESAYPGSIQRSL